MYSALGSIGICELSDRIYRVGIKEHIQMLEERTDVWSMCENVEILKKLYWAVSPEPPESTALAVLFFAILGVMIFVVT